jgi:hypothetical protein
MIGLPARCLLLLIEETKMKSHDTATLPTFKFSRFLGSLGFVLATLMGSQASAGTITVFTDRPSFVSAVGGPLTVEDFTDTFHFPISTGVLNSTTDLVVAHGPPIRPGDIEPGVTYSTAIGTSFFFNIDFIEDFFEGGFLDGFNQPNGNPLAITFDGPISAFAFDTNFLMGNNYNLTIGFASGPSFVQNFTISPTQTLQFFGFLSDRTDILSTVIEGNRLGPFAFVLDNFSFTPTSAIPEPSTVILYSIGAVMVLGRRWLRRRLAHIARGPTGVSNKD